VRTVSIVDTRRCWRHLPRDKRSFAVAAIKSHSCGASDRVSPYAMQMTTCSVPAGGRTWPQRGQALAAWLELGVDAYQDLGAAHGFEPVAGSVAAADRLTLTAHEPRHASAAPWFAILTLTGAGEMVRGLAALYWSTSYRELTRGHLPVMRSIQEHVGRVVWLCEPGAVVWGPGEAPAVTGSDEWGERRLRALLLYEEWMMRSGCRTVSLTLTWPRAKTCPKLSEHSTRRVQT
jgi:hypothetical protein